MSENEQEQAAEETRVPAVPGHQGGAPTPTEGDEEARRTTADSGRAQHVEPRAGLDE